MITVRVFWAGGSALVNKKVRVHSSTGMSEEYTDTNGSANFEHLKRGKYQVYIDGQQVYSGPIVDVQVVYVS